METKQSINDQNLSSESSLVTYEDRIKKQSHAGAIIWLTGLSGSGKSTISKIVEKKLFDNNKQVLILDGDNIRKGLCSDLGFTLEDRSENIRRIAEISLLFAKTGYIVITSFISPLLKDREFAKKISGHFFHCIYLSSSLETCKQRDPKGLYKKALNGELSNFTGIDSPYDEPINPSLILNTNNDSAKNCSNQLFNYILSVSNH